MRIRKRTRLQKLVLTFTILSTIIIAGFVTAQSANKTKSPNKPDLIAVRYHADWCTPCKTLSPNFAKVQKTLHDDSILFVTLDFTNDQSKKQAEFLAASLGLSEMWKTNAKKTGQVMVLNSKKMQIIATLTSNQSPDEMVKVLQSKLAESISE